MKPDKRVFPFINVRTQANLTPTGRRTSRLARQAALYYAFGRHRQEAQREGRQRGQWLGPDGRRQSQEEVMAWVKAKALAHRYTFQGILSVPVSQLTAAEFGKAMQKGGQTEDWRLIAHNDTKHPHAHVLWFGDKCMDKKTFLAWQAEVRAELVKLEQQQLNGPDAQQEMGLGADKLVTRAKSKEVGLEW